MAGTSFSFLQSKLEPYWTLCEAANRTGASGPTFDLMITPMAGVEGKPDTLTFELSRSSCYGIVQISEGVKVISGSGVQILLSTSAFNNLPKVPVDEPVTVEVSDRIYVSYPNSNQMEDIKFDFEYSEQPTLFQRRDPVQPKIGLNQTALHDFSMYIDSASNYAYKKRFDDAMSCIKVSLTQVGMAQFESTTGTEAFFAETQLQGYQNLSGEDLSCLTIPSVWQAGMYLSNTTKADLYIGFDAFSITFLSEGICLTHGLMNFSEFPEIGIQMKKWVAELQHESFNAKIDPIKFREKLKYLESIGLAARSQEPSFIMSNESGKPFIKLKGFMSSGHSKIIDPNILTVDWIKPSEIKLPARIVLQLLNTAETHVMTDFFDLVGLPSVFLSNERKNVILLMAQDFNENA